MPSKLTQIEMQCIKDHASAQWDKAAAKYARANREKYRAFAAYITPAEYNAEEIYRAFAFSILSAQSQFDTGCRAFVKLCKLTWAERRGEAELLHVVSELLYHEVKTRGLSELAEIIQRDHASLLKQEAESWHEYRKRLTKLHGLGKAKATFAACLLYPLDADIACLDTWILRKYGIEEKNGRLSWAEYLSIEAHIRDYARTWKVSTFLAQWIIWDHARGEIESHSIIGLPGQHKNREEMHV